MNEDQKIITQEDLDNHQSFREAGLKVGDDFPEIDEATGLIVDEFHPRVEPGTVADPSQEVPEVPALSPEEAAATQPLPDAPEAPETPDAPAPGEQNPDGGPSDPSLGPVEPRLITQADLDAEPQLVAEGHQVGDAYPVEKKQD